MCSAVAVASVDSDVPMGTAGLMYDSRHAIRVADETLPKVIFFVLESSADRTTGRRSTGRGGKVASCSLPSRREMVGGDESGRVLDNNRSYAVERLGDADIFNVITSEGMAWCLSVRRPDRDMEVGRTVAGLRMGRHDGKKFW